jgi:nitroreductase
METWDAIRMYRAIRSFADRPLAEEHLDRILRAGRRAPSSKNTQRWDFVVCRDRGHLGELSGVGPFAAHIAHAGAAVALVAPAADDPDRHAWIMFDLGQAAQNMLLAAWGVGVGGVHAAVYDEPLARKLLGYPDGYRCDLVISFGYPADDSLREAPPARGGRRPLGDIVHWEHW